MLCHTSIVFVVVVVQSLGHVLLFVTPWTTRCQAPQSSAVSQTLLNFKSIESVIISNHLILCLLLLVLPSVFPSIRIFPSESAFWIRWPKYWSFGFIISPFNVYTGLIFCMIDWFDLLVFQGTLKSLLQHQNLKVSILQHAAYFMVQLSHLYMSIGKAIVLIVF